jgi:predicted PurR-regulated permease PerM
MVESTRINGIRISLRSAFLLLGAIAVAVLALRILASSARVVGWILMAAAVAGLLHPLVVALARRIPRGLAVAVVVIGVLGSIGLAGYELVDDIERQTARLEEIAPRRAREIQRSERFGEAAREFKLEKRTRRFIKAIPERLRGGDPAEAVRAATTRGLAFLATGVLTIFFLLHGTRLARGALGQISDTDRRERATGIVRRVYHRSFGYARGVVALSVLNGLIAYALARAADVPGPVALATWVALWNIVPVFGFVIGTAPIVILAAFRSPATALVLTLAFAAYEVVEGGVLRPRLERRTMRLGRFLTVLGAFGGLELYGLGGALLAVLALAGLVALADEVSAADTERVLG